MPSSDNGRPDTGRPGIYQDVTDTIIAELEAGCPPWVQPWSSETLPLAIPCNAVTERCYSGVNVLLLWRAARRASYRSRGWLTFRQALAAGGQVRRGERGTSVVYAHRFAPESERQRASESGDEARSFGVLKRFTVFNVEQCDGLDARFVLGIEPERVPEDALIERSEELIAASGVEIRLGACHAFYSVHDDRVHLPSSWRFDDALDRERVCLHELVHATGHPSRLDRDLSNPFGTPGYAREELIAELGAAFLCAALSIPPTLRHANYIASWLDILRGDKRAIFKAAAAATTSANWLLDRRVAMLVDLNQGLATEEAVVRSAAAA